VRFMMPPGSVLRVGGPSAGPNILHALPAASSARLSFTFRKLGAAARAVFDAAADAKLQARARRCDIRGSACASGVLKANRHIKGK
jgi:hypothetical protein